MPDALSHYTLLEKIGTGGMGTVYRAEDRETGRVVALKTLHQHLAADAEYVRRFEAEARIAQSIDSPNVVKVLDYGHDGETYFLVMEFVPGNTLADVIQQRGELPVPEAVSIAAAIASALVAANAKAIVHRDISPQNVMITPEGEAKVTDFGVSRDLTQQTMTATSMLVGKPLYIAPEVASGTSKADIRSDIYALGVVAFQMLAGTVPFNAETPFAVMMKHVSEPVPSLRGSRADVPLWLAALVERCLAKEPRDRPQSPHAVLEAIAAKDDSTVRLTREAATELNPRNSLETIVAHTPLRADHLPRVASSITMELRKRSDGLAGRPAEFTLLLRNPSQRLLSLRLDGYDDKDSLQFDMPRIWNLAAGAENEIHVKTMPRIRRLFGSRTRHNFTVRASSDGLDGGTSLTATGAFEEGPPAWPAFSAIVGLLLVAAVGAGTAVAMSGGNDTTAVVAPPGAEPTSFAPTVPITPATPVPTPRPSQAYSVSWTEPRAGQQLPTGRVLMKASYGVGSDPRPIARVDFNVWQNGWRNACSAFAPSGQPLAMPGASIPTVYSYECTADLSGGPFGTVAFTFDLIYTDGHLSTPPQGRSS